MESPPDTPPRIMPGNPSSYNQSNARNRQEKSHIMFQSLLKELELANQREQANIFGSTRIDWAKIGIHNSYRECAKFARTVAGQENNDFILNECEIFELACPDLNIIPTELMGAIPEEGEHASIPTRATGKSTACGIPREPMCFKYHGEWSLEDMVGDFENPVTGIKTMHRAMPFEHKKDVLVHVTLDQPLEMDSDTTEILLETYGRTLCQKIARILEVGPDKVTVGTDIRGDRIHDGPVTLEMDDIHTDLMIYARINGEKYPLLAVEVKIPSMEHLLSCLQWNYYEEQEGVLPAGDKPNSGEINRAVKIMKQLLDYCLAYGLVEILLWDGISTTAIKFDLAEEKTHERQRRRQRDKFPPTIGVVGFWCRRISYQSVDLTFSYMMAVMAWRQLKLIKNEKKFKARRLAVQRAGSDLLLDEQILAKVNNIRAERRKRRQEKREAGRSKRQHSSDGVWAGYSFGAHVPKLEFDTLQDGDHCHRVLRMQRAQYTKLFPNLKCRDKSIVLKVLDVYSVGAFYDRHAKYDLCKFDYDSFVDKCEEHYITEVTCYERIERYNRVCEPKICAPRLWGYGYTYLTDEKGQAILGFYIALEDLGVSETMADKREFEDLVDDQLDLLETIGIEHGDVADRNIIVRDSKVYILDFEMAELSASQNIFV